MKGTTSKAPLVTRISNGAKKFTVRWSLDGGFRSEGPPPQPSRTSSGSCHVREAVQRGLVDPTHCRPTERGQQHTLQSPSQYVFTNARPSLATPVLPSETPPAAHSAQKREERSRRWVSLRSPLDAGEEGEWRGPGGRPSGNGRSTDVATDCSDTASSLPLASSGARRPRSRSIDIPGREEVVGRQRRSSATFVRNVDGYRFGVDAVDYTPDFSDLSVAVVLDPTHPQRRSMGDAAVPLAELASEELSDLYLQKSLARQSSGSLRNPLISPKSSSFLNHRDHGVMRQSNPTASLDIHTRLPRRTSFQMESRVSFQEKVEILTVGRV